MTQKPSKPATSSQTNDAAAKAKPGSVIPGAIAVILAITGVLLAFAIQWGGFGRDNTIPIVVLAPVETVALPSAPHWGTYRPNLYLGVRGMWPDSPLFGWLWSCAPTDTQSCNAEQQISQIRHDAEERDGLTSYGWKKHNGDNFGVQHLIDKKMHVNFTTTFLRPAAHSDRWVMRVHAASTEKSQSKKKVSLYFYTALASKEHSLELKAATAPTRGKPLSKNPFTIEVEAGEIAPSLSVRSDLASSIDSDAEQSNEGLETFYYAAYVETDPSKIQAPPQGAPAPIQHTWAAKELVQRATTEQYRHHYESYQNQYHKAKAAHEKKHGPVTRESKVPFVPPPEPLFSARLPNVLESRANFLVIQRVLTLPTTMDFVMAPGEVPLLDEGGKELGATEKWFPASSNGVHAPLSAIFQSEIDKFDKEFDEKFPLESITSTTAANNKNAPAAPKSNVEFAQALLSNLLGGIGYFSGKQLIEDKPSVPASKNKPEIPAVIRETKDSVLFSAVPSRSFFPRGFMWDEGFHNLLVARWNPQLSLQILGTWFSQIQLDSKPLQGWLPREQILGEEARKRVPREFQAQKPWVANPPVLILSLQKLLERSMKKQKLEKAANNGQLSEATRQEKETLDRFVETWLPTLHVHVSWFFKTQASTTLGLAALKSIDLYADKSSTTTSTEEQEAFFEHFPVSFRWAGRTLSHCLASGLDDYPRAKFLPQLARDKKNPASQEAADTLAGILTNAEQRRTLGVEGHVDLHAWMIILAKTMAQLNTYMHEAELTAAPTSNAGAAGASKSSQKIHYAALSQSYESYASLLTRTLLDLHWDSTSNSFYDYIYRNSTRQFDKHIGYVSLLPLFLTSLDPVKHEQQIVSILTQLRSDSWSVWTRFGIRSLSRHDADFGSKEDYWRGHIWICMQYLAYQGLDHYQKHEQSSQQIRTLAGELKRELRENVAGNVAKEYRRTGYVWEQYHALDGKGRKSHPFTGWTALTLLMMTEEQ